MMISERRTKRSNRSHIALACYLEAEASRSDVAALAVGTTDGLPIASWGAADPLHMAAAGAIFVEGQRERAREEFGALRAETIEIDGGQLVVSSLGSVSDLTKVAPHVARILAI